MKMFAGSQGVRHEASVTAVRNERRVIITAGRGKKLRRWSLQFDSVAEVSEVIEALIGCFPVEDFPKITSHAIGDADVTFTEVDDGYDVRFSDRA